jgi:hypothetical protein
MKKSYPSWVLNSIQFDAFGFHVKPTVAYRLMFEYLLRSPSYELARKANMEGLSIADKKILPSDFDQVLKTYKLLGDVRFIAPGTWWLTKGIKAFGNQSPKPEVRKIFEFDGASVDKKLLDDQLTTFIDKVRPYEGQRKSLLVNIPIGLKKSEVHKYIDALLNEVEPNKEISTSAKLVLEGQRLRVKSLLGGIRLLSMRAAKPDWELWRLGTKLEYSRANSRELDLASPRRTMDSSEAVHREALTKTVHKSLMKYERTAENAARGKFPSDAEVEKVEFDYPALKNRLIKISQWEKSQKR